MAFEGTFLREHISAANETILIHITIIFISTCKNTLWIIYVKSDINIKLQEYVDNTSLQDWNNFHTLAK